MSCHRKAAAAVAALGMILAGLSVPGAHAERGDAPHQPHLAYQEPTAGPQLDPTAPGVNPRRIVAILKSGKASSAIVRSLPLSTAKVRQAGQRLVVVDVAPGGDPRAVVRAMLASGLYEAVDYDGTRRALDYTATPNDPRFSNANAYALKGAPGGSRFNEVWAELGAAPPETAPVAVIDTGLSSRHEDLGDNITGGWDYAENRPSVTASDPHGTAVSGIIGAATNNGIGMAGAAWDTPVVVYKASTRQNPGEFSDAACVSAIMGAVADGAKVINMSLGGPGFSSVWKKALDYAADHGVIVIAASGNDGENDVGYPAAYARVVSVAATNSAGGPVSWSSSNPGVNIAAAGVSVGVMTVSGYITSNGTSFASPYVAAGAALIRRFRPDLSPSQIIDTLYSTARDVTTSPASPGWDRYTGHGILDVRAALDKAKTLVAVPHVDPALTVATMAAGDPVDWPLRLAGDPDASVTWVDATAVPPGVSLAKAASGWTLTGAPTAVGTFEFAIQASGVGGTASTSLTLTVTPGAIASLSVKPSALAVTAHDGATWVLAGHDRFGNTIPDTASASTVSASFPDCRFAAGAAPSYRVCVITASYAGAFGTATGRAEVAVFDAAALVPSVLGVARVGETFSASAPAGWPDLGYRWFHNEREVGSSRSFTAVGARAGDALRVVVTLNHRGLSLAASSPSIHLSAALEPPQSARPSPSQSPPPPQTTKLTLTLKATAKGIKVVIRSSSGLSPAGSLKISYASTKLTKKLKASHKGKLTVPLKKLKPKKRTAVKVTFTDAKTGKKVTKTIRVTRKK